MRFTTVWALWAIGGVLVSTLGAPMAYAQPEIEAALEDALVDDQDGDGVADRGDTIGYTVVVVNNGDEEAINVEVSLPLDPNLTLVPGSVKVGPIALDDEAVVELGQQVIIDVLANDRDVDGTLEPATVTIVEVPSEGTAVLFDPATGEIAYTSTGVSGTDTFRYTVEDNDGLVSRAALVSVTSSACPTAEDDLFEVDEKDTVSGNVLDDNGNGPDSDPEDDPLEVIEVNGAPFDDGIPFALPSGALLTISADGAMTYDPNGVYDALADGETDTDTFTYTITDGVCTDTATVTITINGENDCPVAQDDEFEVDEKDTLSGNVMDDNGNGPDFDPDTNDTITVTEINGSAADIGNQITLPSGALLTLNADGTFDYDPDGAFDALGDGETDTDTFEYTLSDGDCTDTATVTITINGENDCPVAQDDLFEVDEKDTLTGNVKDDNGNGPDADPDANDTLTVTEVNGNAAGIGSQITLPSGALLTLNSDGTFEYDPNGVFDALGDGETDVDTFAYTISDGVCDDSATVTITINGENDCPVARDDLFGVAANQGLNGNVLDDNGNGPDFDPDANDTLTVVAVNGAPLAPGTPFTLPSGALLNMASDGDFAYDPNGAFDHVAFGDFEDDVFTYTISDGDAACDQTATVTISVAGVNTPPTVADFTAQTAGNTQLQVAASKTIPIGVFLAGSLLDGASDPDGPDPLTASLVSASPGATVVVNPDGTFLYVPPAGQTTNDQFTFAVSDGLDSTQATATIGIVDRIWYVNNTSVGGGSGRSTDPFNTLASAQTASSPGDAIYILTGTGTATGQNAGIVLQNSQRLLGEGAALNASGTINGVSNPELRAAGSPPLIANSGGNGVALAFGNTLRGISIGATSGAGVAGSGFGTLTVSDVGIFSGGAALDLSVGTLDAVFSSISSGSSVNAISLENIAGSLTVNGGSVSGATGAAFFVNGGSLSVTYSGNISQGNNAPLVSILGGHNAGTITFQTGTLSATNGTGLRFNNANGTYNFNGPVTLNGGNAAIGISNGSSGAFTFANTAITNPSGPALDIENSAATLNYTGGSVTQNRVGVSAVRASGNSGGVITINVPVTANSTIP